MGSSRVASAVSRARSAQALWSARPLGERVAAVSRFSELVDARQEACAVTLTRDTGKPISQSRNEMRAAVSRLAYFAGAAEAALSERVVSSAGRMLEVIRYEPLGVVANVSAWNFPWFIGLNVWAPGLAAGNAVLYKPSEHAVGTARLVEDLWREAGVPDGVFASLEPDAGAELVGSDVDGVFFTGSNATGRKIARATAERLVKTQLELGGKDAAYVADDVTSPSAAAEALADGACYNAGQSCCSVERIYVHRAVYDAFVSHLVRTVESFTVGSEWDPNTYIGPMCLASQPAFLQCQVDDAVKRGAQQLTGFARPPTPRHFMPTVLTGVTRDMAVAQAESFGPIVAVARVDDDAEALHLVNDSHYGLTSSIYTNDRARAEAFLKHTKTGSAYWNCCDRTSPTLPWSGRRASGIGLTMSHLGIQTFAHPRGFHLCSPAGASD